jgi:uncharacterized coiled-coil DUF342 family protein
MNPDWIIGLVAVFLIFGGGNVLKSWFETRAEIERIRLQQGNARTADNSEVMQALQELRREVSELRETSTRFDMSFDAAVTSLEQRVERVEATQYNTRSTSTAEEPLTLRRG